MASLLLAEELFLLAHDGASGRLRPTTSLETGIAGALLLELASEGLIEARDSQLVALPGRPGHPLLRAAHGTVVHSTRTHGAHYWVRHLPTLLRPLDQQVGWSLVGREMVRSETKSRLGLMPRTVWPTRDDVREHSLRRRLARVLVDGYMPSPDTALLICVLAPLNLVGPLVDPSERRAARDRAADIIRTSEGRATSQAVGMAFGQAVRAVMAHVSEASGLAEVFEPRAGIGAAGSRAHSPR